MSETHPQVMLIGFAYSMQDNAEPGSYNEELARLMQNDHDVLSANQLTVWLAMQWEVADALALAKSAIVPDDSHVAFLFDFGTDDILRPERIVQLLAACPTRALEIVWERLKSELLVDGHELNPNLPNKDQRENLIVQTGLSDTRVAKSKLAGYFNRILRDSLFYERFHEQEGEAVVHRLELHDFYRLPLGSVGVEKRKLPDAAGPLGVYQSRRVNRLILQAVFAQDQPLLQAMSYLSTQDGVNKYLSQLEKEHPGAKIAPPGRVVVYGHPEHRDRCRRQFLATAFGAGWEFDPKSVHLAGQGVKIPVAGGNVTLGSWAADMWDADTAQVWCRSKRNWEDYESMGNLRLH